MPAWKNRAFIIAVLLALAPLGRAVGQGFPASQTHTLTTGTGDGSVTVVVHGSGGFGNATVSQFTNYDPIGPVPSGSTTFRSEVALGLGTTPSSRSWLTPPATAPTGTATSCTSSFTMGNLSFQLTQSVAQTFVSGVQTGSVLTQTYTITNTGTTTENFDLVRYIDGDLQFDGSISDGGGRLPGPPETLFETDAGGGGSTSTTFLGITATGGTTPTTNRFEVNGWSGLAFSIQAGNPLSDTINGDTNADQFVDPGNEYDLSLALRNVFTLAPGASTVYTTTTIFGSGTPASAIPPPAGVTITQSGGTTSVAEGGATDTYTVVLNSAPTANVTITLNAGTQLTVVPATLTFTPANWNVAQTVTVTAVDDAVVEGAHSGTITHSAASADSNYNGVTIVAVTASISDNDTGTPPPSTGTGGPEGSFTGTSAGPAGPEGTFGRTRTFPSLLGPFPGSGAGLNSASDQIVLNVTHRSWATQGSAHVSETDSGMVLLALVSLIGLAVAGSLVNLRRNS